LAAEAGGVAQQGLTERDEESGDLSWIEIERFGELRDGTAQDRVVTEAADERPVYTPIAMLHSVDQGAPLLNEFGPEPKQRQENN